MTNGQECKAYGPGWPFDHAGDDAPQSYLWETLLLMPHSCSNQQLPAGLALCLEAAGKGISGWEEDLCHGEGVGQLPEL